MPAPPDRALRRIVDRLGARRLAADPTLARTALKDLFPGSPLVVSVLTAAVEQGTLAALLTDDRAVPIDVLGPRLADGLRRSSGIDVARARWAVAAWAHALGRLEDPPLALPEDGSPPEVGDVFRSTGVSDTVPNMRAAQRPPRPAAPTGPVAPTGAEDMTTGVPASVPDDDATRPVVRMTKPPAAGTPTPPAVASAAAAQAPAPSTEKPTLRLRKEPEVAAAAPDVRLRKEPGDAPAPARSPEAASPEVPAREVPEDATGTAPTVRLSKEPVRPTLTAPTEPQPTVARPAAPEETVVRPVADAGTVAPAAAPLATAAASPATAAAPSASAARPATAARPAAPAPPPATPARRRRRAVLLAAVAAVVLLVVVAGGAVAALLLLQRPSGPTVQRAADATVTTGGTTRDLAAGAVLERGSVVTARGGTVELAAASGVVRLAEGARARIDGPAKVTLLAGRAFAASGADAITVEAGALSTAVHDGRLLAACPTPTSCSATTLDEALTTTLGGRARALAAAHRIDAAGEVTAVVPQAIRDDPWFTANDALDVKQHRSPTGVEGPVLDGEWRATLERSDLPVALTRRLAFAPSCDGSGCVLRATTSMTDNIDRVPLTGTVRITSAGAMTVDYGSHPARCRYDTELEAGGPADGRETIVDTFTARGSGASATVTGTRTTVYTPTRDNCTAASFHAPERAALTAAAGELVKTDPAYLLQQPALNYLPNPQQRCAAASSTPSADRVADFVCTFAVAPTRVEFATYTTTQALQAAYAAAADRYGPRSSGACGSGPCEQADHDREARVRVAVDSGGPVLVTSENSGAHLLVIARGASASALFAWWSDQPRTRATYTAYAIPRVGV